MTTILDQTEVDRLRASTVRRIHGPTILLGSGEYFDFLDPEGTAHLVSIADVAWGLAGCNRFAGQTIYRGARKLYTVAQHCYLMSHAVPDHLAYPALMHECGEAVCGDMTGPLKSICPEFAAIEKRCGAAIMRRFGVSEYDQVELKNWDLRMLATEQRDLMPIRGETWSSLEGVKPLRNRIRPISASNAAFQFLLRFWQLTGAI